MRARVDKWVKSGGLKSRRPRGLAGSSPAPGIALESRRRRTGAAARFVGLLPQSGGFEGFGLLVGEIGLHPRRHQVIVECPDGPKLQIQVDAAPDSPSLGVLADKNLVALDPEIKGFDRLAP